MKAKRIMGFFLSLVMFTAYLPLNPIASYADGDGVKIDDNFPDENFKKYVKENFDNDGNGILSKDECDNVTNISVGSKSISSLQGIEHFKNLTILNCYYNQLTSLDVSQNTKLTYLDCNNNQLPSLDVSQNTKLTFLICHVNKLTSLDVSRNTKLTKLNCSTNKLKSLDVSKNTALTHLYCDQNTLTEIDVSKNPALISLDCSYNKLKSLDLSKNPALELLECVSCTQLKELDLSRNTKLTLLHCHGTPLKSLDLSKNTALTYLDCHETPLKSLDLSKNEKLTKLYGYKNPLTSVKLINKNYEQVDLSPVTYTVEVEKGSKKIPLDKLPQGFNKDNIKSEVTGASVESDGFTWDGKANTIKFKYQLCENPNETVDVEITVHVLSMIVKTQPKLSYTEGEKLDLEGLVVTLTDNQGPTKYVAFKDFEANGIKIEQVNGTVLTLADSGKKIKLTKGNLSAETESLTVNKKVIGPVDPKDSNSEKPADVSKYYTVTFETEDETKGTVNAKNTFYVLKTERKTLADIVAPEVTAKEGYEFDKWEPTLDKNTAIDKDLKVKAHFKKVKKKSYNKKPQGAKNGKFPKTANSINIAFNTAFMILSGALLVLAVKKRKKS